MRVMIRRILVILVAAGIGGVASESRAEEWTQSFTIEEDALRVANLVGEVQIEGHRGSSFEVEVHVRGKDAGRDAIHVEEKAGKSASLVVLFPVDREKDYVYPPLGRSKSSFHMSNRSEGSWWKEALGLFSRDKIQVSGNGRGMEVWADITVKVPSGGRLLLEHGVGRTMAQNVTGDLNLNTRSGGVEVTSIEGNVRVDTGSGGVIVADAVGDVSVDTGSGNVAARNIEGEINIDTGSGSVNIDNGSGSRILVDTGSGGVTLKKVSCRSLSVDTGSGGITARGVMTEEATLDTGSGSVILDLAQMTRGDIEIDTGSGSIDLRLPPSASARVEASTGSGGIHIDVDQVKMIEKSRNEKSFEIGDGRGSRITLETGSGSIHVSS